MKSPAVARLTTEFLAAIEAICAARARDIVAIRMRGLMLAEARAAEEGTGAVNRPRWRWLLWCALNWLHIRTSWRWVDRAWLWAILPAWVGADDFVPLAEGEEAPF